MQGMRFLLTVLLGTVLSGAAIGQSTIKGFLRDKGSGEPVMFANVTLQGTTYGAVSDIEGYFSLSQIPAGTYTLVVASMGHEEVREEVNLASGKILTKNYLLLLFLIR
jgi:hypothetical protein